MLCLVGVRLRELCTMCYVLYLLCVVCCVLCVKVCVRSAFVGFAVARETAFLFSHAYPRVCAHEHALVLLMCRVPPVAGEVLSSPEVGVLASVGACEVSVHRLPRVGVLSTGDELVDASVVSVWNSVCAHAYACV